MLFGDARKNSFSREANRDDTDGERRVAEPGRNGGQFTPRTKEKHAVRTVTETLLTRDDAAQLALSLEMGKHLDGVCPTASFGLLPAVESDVHLKQVRDRELQTGEHPLIPVADGVLLLGEGLLLGGHISFPRIFLVYQK